MKKLKLSAIQKFKEELDNVLELEKEQQKVFDTKFQEFIKKQTKQFGFKNKSELVIKTKILIDFFSDLIEYIVDLFDDT